jgi:MOSC domain-containing protein YiiM
MSAGRILQINVSRGGVPKVPVMEAEIGPLGISGDSHRMKRIHGGPRKALLLLAAEVIDALKAQGWPVFYGALGENLTTHGLDHRLWQSGRRFQIGQILIELTDPREPCRTLDRYGKGIQQRLLQSCGETGFYASVLTGGRVAQNAIIEDVERVS